MCRIRQLNKGHPRSAWGRDRSEVGKHFILIFCSQIAGNGALRLGRARAEAASAARQTLAEPYPLLDADRVVN